MTRRKLEEIEAKLNELAAVLGVKVVDPQGKDPGLYIDFNPGMGRVLKARCYDRDTSALYNNPVASGRFLTNTALYDQLETLTDAARTFTSLGVLIKPLPRTTVEEEEDEPDLDIRYRCPDCGHTWEEQYPAACDSECEECGLENIEALMWKHLDDEWSEAEEQEWKECDRCTCGHEREDHDLEEYQDGPCKIEGCKCEGYEVDFSRYQTTKGAT